MRASMPGCPVSIVKLLLLRPIRRYPDQLNDDEISQVKKIQGQGYG